MYEYIHVLCFVRSEDETGLSVSVVLQVKQIEPNDVTEAFYQSARFDVSVLTILHVFTFATFLS